MKPPAKPSFCALKELIILASSLAWALSTIASTADLRLHVGAAPSPVVVGGSLTLTFAVSNQGPDTATGIVLSNPLPPSVIFTSGVVTNGSYTISNNLFCYSLESLAAKASFTIQVVVTPVTAQFFSNRVSVVASETDPWIWDNVNQYNMIPVMSVAPGANSNMTRHYHTGTLLTNGTVLLTGGDIWFSRSNRITATTEIYDPQAETFTFGPDMSTSRVWHTATLLPNGQVLVAGGEPEFYVTGTSGPAASIECYDPVANALTSSTHLAYPRSRHTATLLPDGRVLFLGGNGAGTNAEYYDYHTGTISTAGGTLTPRLAHWAALLPNGKVLIVGGYQTQPVAEVFDPATGSSKAVPLATTNNIIVGAISLLNGNVLVLGAYRTAQLFDPEREEFALTGQMVWARYDPRLTLLNDGRALVSGGGSPVGYLQSTEIYDPVIGTFSESSPMTEPRVYHTATRLQDGRVLLAAGWNAQALSTSEIYADKVDRDLDGMDDGWEVKYGFNPADRTDAIQDADGDGHTNLQEYLAGTDPRDPHSLLRIETFQVASNLCRIRFSSAVGRLYRVERTSAFPGTNWLTVSENLVGTGKILEVFDPVTSGTTRQWYRICVLR